MIKLNAWENYFFKKAISKREKELSYLTTLANIWSGTIGFFWLLPSLITTAVFFFYIFFGNTITTEKAFIFISVFSLI